MSTKSTIRHQDRERGLPGWQIYEDLFEKDDVVYLELDGVEIDVTMTGGSLGEPPAATVLLRLPTGSARQLGLVAHDWTRGRKWDEDRTSQVLDRLRRIADAKRGEGRAMIKRAPFLRIAMAGCAVWLLARIAFPRSERRKGESALSAIDSVLAGKPNGRAKTRSILADDVMDTLGRGEHGVFA